MPLYYSHHQEGSFTETHDFGTPVITVTPVDAGVMEKSGLARNNTPGFHKLKKRKPSDLPMKPFNSVTFKTVSGKYRYVGKTVYTPTGQRFLYEDYGQRPIPFAPDLWLSEDNAVDAGIRARTTLFEQLAGAGSNIANMMAERQQTANMVGNTLKSIYLGMRDIRHGNIEDAVRRFGGSDEVRKRSGRKTVRIEADELRPKNVANIWLALQYGWKPMLQDVYDTIDGLQARRLAGETLVVKGKGHVKGSRTKSENSWAIPPTWTHMPTQGERWKNTTVKYVIKASPDNIIHPLSSFGITNPAVVLWEVTPWSFVVDWFLPIGKYLEELSASFGWTFIDGCMTTFNFIEEQAHYFFSQHVETGGGDYVTDDVIAMHGAYARIFVLDRQVIADFPSPDTPRFKNPVSIGHALNSLALVTQIFKVTPPPESSYKPQVPRPPFKWPPGRRG